MFTLCEHYRPVITRLQVRTLKKETRLYVMHEFLIYIRKEI